MRREYQSGTQWCLWQWKEIYWHGNLYLRRLHVIQTPWFAVMVHWIMGPDMQRHLHDHPVSMLSVVLKGWYVELAGDDYRTCCWLNWIPAHKAHRIIALDPDGGAVTLVFSGPREREWGFHTESGWVPWREYQRLYGGETS